MKTGSRRFAPILLAAASLSSAALAGGPPPETCPAIDDPTLPGAQSVRAFRDPATGRLRPPTAEELRRTSQQGQIRERAARVPVIVTRADGTKVADLGGEFLMQVVVEKQPDGSTRLRCVPPAAAGER
jgi:hypothetical protein